MEKENIKIAVIGRPNVGKSTLFNRLIKERKSIIDDTPGVTRDRLYANIEWNGKPLTLIDTGGLVNGYVGVHVHASIKDEILKEVTRQVEIAINESDCIIFLVDGKSGITSQDEKIANNLRRIKDKKKIFVAVNKIDTEKQKDLVYEFYSLGLGEPYPISALSGSIGLADILDEISSVEMQLTTSLHRDNEVKVAIIGKPNVGKSSILNSLVGEERSIVTSIAGTTRDCIDTKIKIGSDFYTLIDTAGLRRKSKVSSNIERYSTSRSISAIEKADVVLLVIDATSHISDQDQKIASLIKRRYKPTVVLINKWDLIDEKKPNTVKKYNDYVLLCLHFIGYSKVLFTCRGIPWNVQKPAKDASKLWKIVKEIYKNNQFRISTSKLNKVLENIILVTPPPSKKGKRLRIYYVTQTNIMPPEIVFFVNDNKLVSKSYEAFLEKQIRNNFDFSGTPIKMVFRNKTGVRG